MEEQNNEQGKELKPVEKTKFPANNYTDIKPRTKKDISTGKGKVREKKKTVGERIADDFLATDGEELKEHFIFDWLIPGIKTIVEDIVHMLLYGSGGRSDIRRDRGESRIKRTPYNSIYDGRRRQTDEYVSRKGSRQPELIFDYRADAEQVLSGMNEYIDDYGSATIKDFYNIVSTVSEGVIDVPTDFTMTKWGWYDLTDASVVHVRGGYLLKMPKAEVIGR